MPDRTDLPWWVSAVGVSIVVAIPWAVEGVVRLSLLPSTPRDADEWWTGGPVWAWMAVYSALVAFVLVVPRTIVSQFAKDVAPSIDAGVRRPAEAANWVRDLARYPGPRAAACATWGVLAGVAIKLIDDRYGGHATSARFHGSVAWAVCVGIAMAVSLDSVAWVLGFTWFIVGVTGRGVWSKVTAFAPAQTPGLRELREFAGTIGWITGIALILFAIPITWAVAYAGPSKLTILRTMSAIAVGIVVALGVATVGIAQWTMARWVRRERDRILYELDREIDASDALSLADPKQQEKIALFNQVASSPIVPSGVTSMLRWGGPHIVAVGILLLGWIGSTFGLYNT